MKKLHVFNWQSSLTLLEGAYSDETLRAYRADIQAYVKWCVSEKLTPFPADAQSMANYIETQSEAYSASTIKRRLAAIGKIHEILGLENPNSNSFVMLALRRSLRSKSSRPRQALGISADMRNKLIEACNNSLSGKRDKALIAIGYDTLCRRSEIAAIRIEDIEFNDNHTGKILIRRSKNDPLGIGRIAHLSPRSIKLLKNWIKASSIKGGHVFRSIRYEIVQSNGLHPHSV